MKITLLVAAAFSLSSTLATDSPNGAITALAALPSHFARDVVRLSADRGRPNPGRWYVLARNPEEAGLIVKNPLSSITIAGGQLSEAKRYVDARQIFKLHQYCKGARRFRRCFSNRQGIPRDCRTEDGERQLSTHPNRARRRPRMGCLGVQADPATILASSGFPRSPEMSFHQRRRDFPASDGAAPWHRDPTG